MNRRSYSLALLGLCFSLTGCAGNVGTSDAPSGETDLALDPAVPAGPPLRPTSWKFVGGQTNEHFGYSVANAGDVNGDGYDDVIVGSTNYDGSAEVGRADEGRAYVFLGSASGLSEVPAWTSGPGAGYSNAEYGWSVAGAGDVNGDGYDDVIVGAPSATNGESDEGRAFLFHGSPTGPEETPAWIGESNQESADYGDCVAGAGDVNGDGYADVIVSASDYDDGQDLEGLVYVYFGSAEGLANHALWTAESNQMNTMFGHSAASAGDVNGDGYSDVIIGAPLYDSPEVDEGRAYVWLGGPVGLAQSPAWTVEGNQREGWFGWSVASAGDVNHDGYDDVLVGAPGYDDGEVDEGRVLLYLGSPFGLAMTHAWGGEGDAEGTKFGWSVAPAFDLNADGHSDVIVGAPSYDGAGEDEGRAFVYLGTETGLRFASSAEIEGDRTGGRLGFSVASAGDVNADGVPDIAMGSPDGNGELIVRLGFGRCGPADSDRDGVLDCVDSCPQMYAPTPNGCPAGGGGGATGGSAGTGAGGTGAGGTGAGGTGGTETGGTGAGGTETGGTGAGATETGGRGAAGTETGGTGAGGMETGGTETGGNGTGGTGNVAGTSVGGTGSIDPGHGRGLGVDVKVGCGCRVPVGERTDRGALPLALAALGCVGWRRRRRHS